MDVVSKTSQLATYQIICPLKLVTFGTSLKTIPPTASLMSTASTIYPVMLLAVRQQIHHGDKRAKRPVCSPIVESLLRRWDEFPFTKKKYHRKCHECHRGHGRFHTIWNILMGRSMDLRILRAVMERDSLVVITVNLHLNLAPLDLLSSAYDKYCNERAVVCLLTGQKMVKSCSSAERCQINVYNIWRALLQARKM